MILTCPNCATRFFADDDAIGPAGRRVKCADCGEVWMGVGVENSVDLSSMADTAEDTVKDGERDATNDAPLFVERGPPPRKTVRRPSRAPLIAGLAILVIVIVGVFVFQHQIERMFPGASTVYQSLGLGSFDRAGV